jgi:hypothetical protein
VPVVVLQPQEGESRAHSQEDVAESEVTVMVKTMVMVMVTMVAMVGGWP